MRARGTEAALVLAVQQITEATHSGTMPRQRAPDGGVAETADDGFSLKGIDFTHNPGVPGAQIHSASFAESAKAGFIYESLEDIVMTETNAQPQPTHWEARRQRMATELLESAQRAEEDITGASLQDLEALAALRFG
jgi:hypothetical protein